MGILILFFILSITFSFLCSIWEAVLLSITPSYSKRKLTEGSQTGLLLREYKEDIDKPLSAILTLNTIAHTAGAIGVGAQASKLYGSNEWDLGFIQISPESIIAGAMTLAILILSEIIPKTIGANMWKSLVPFTVSSIRVLLIILWPFVKLSQLITWNLKKDKHRSVLSRADFAAITQVGEESGAIQKSESKIIINLLRFDELTVRDIMTPRTVIVHADQETTLMEFYEKTKPLRFSRIPLYKDEPDKISGMILKDELFQKIVEGNGDEPLSSIRREISHVPDNQPLPKLFEFLTREKVHLSMVVDEFGSIVGLVSMEDLFETLLGLEITDESDDIEDLQRYARDRWNERAKKLGLIE